MKIRLGYLGTPNSFLEGSHTMTLKQYQKIEEPLKKLEEIIFNNLKILEKIIEFNYQNKIFFYRISANLFPLKTVQNIDYSLDKFQSICERIGQKIKKYGMRVDIHADHFLILNSRKKEVQDISIKMLNTYQEFFDLLKIAGKVILHIGSKYQSKEEGLKVFEMVFLKLNKCLQEMIVLENDDKTYTVTETLLLCEKLQIPMVLDYHHFLCNHEPKEKINDFLTRILNTWRFTNLNPKMHFSSPKNNKEKRTHHFYIDYHSFLKFINILEKFNIDIDIMLECKGKEESLLKLTRQIKFYKPLKIKNNTIYLLTGTNKPL